jgi:Zn-dependent peptidase ImmA (M78 family)
LKHTVNELLGDGDGYAQNPKVDIELLAKDIGIKEIKYVPEEEIWAKYPDAHAYIDIENSIIYVSNSYKEEKRRFLIAHEIFHLIFVLYNKNGCALSIFTRRGDAWKKEHSGSAEAEGEDIADYFAANLLIPTERFILWEEKTNEEIAKAFGVEPRCIEKRKGEIEYEIKMLEPQSLPSDKDTDA